MNYPSVTLTKRFDKFSFAIFLHFFCTFYVLQIGTLDMLKIDTPHCFCIYFVFLLHFLAFTSLLNFFCMSYLVHFALILHLFAFTLILHLCLHFFACSISFAFMLHFLAFPFCLHVCCVSFAFIFHLFCVH